MATSRPLFVYLQRPDTGDWVTVGRYRVVETGVSGAFRYAPSYLEAGHPWAIDPVNLPLIPGEHIAHRYRGLHDVLRDASPDAWGRLVLQRAHNLGDNALDLDFLRIAQNGDRWGALAIGPSPAPSVGHLQSPALPKLAILSEELLAMYRREPAVDKRVRRMLVATASLGGARPKGSLQDGDDFWLVKPVLPTDPLDIPRLEHFAQQWGAVAGLNFAPTVHHEVPGGLSVIRILRYDRHGPRRAMTLSAASMLSTEYPGGKTDQWSYPRLSEELKRIGAPVEDQIELFGRMVFNAIVGNDDDHPRNHAAIYVAQEKRWRLSPAFDVVPNPELSPTSLTMQLSAGRFDIARDAMLADAMRFGFASPAQAQAHLDALLARFHQSFPVVAPLLPQALRALMLERLAQALQMLR